MTMNKHNKAPTVPPITAARFTKTLNINVRNVVYFTRYSRMSWVWLHARYEHWFYWYCVSNFV